VATSQTDPTWAEFYRVDGVLALQALNDVELSGHPGIDLESLPLPESGGFERWCAGYHLPVSQVAKIKRWTSQGLFVAISVVAPKRRKRNRQELIVSWAKPGDYLDESQLFWLKAYCDSSFVYTGKRDELTALEALKNVFQAIGEIAASSGVTKKTKVKKVKQPKVKRKIRRVRETDSLEGYI
jgi:selenophosphate synthetase-related protein